MALRNHLRRLGIRVFRTFVDFRNKTEIRLGGNKVLALPIPETITPVGAFALTFTANAPGAANGAQTIADGNAISNANTAEFMAEVTSRLAADRTAINEILTALESHGLIAEE